MQLTCQELLSPFLLTLLIVFDHYAKSEIHTMFLYSMQKKSRLHEFDSGNTATNSVMELKLALKVTRLAFYYSLLDDDLSKTCMQESSFSFQLVQSPIGKRISFLM